MKRLLVGLLAAFTISVPAFAIPCPDCGPPTPQPVDTVVLTQPSGTSYRAPIGTIGPAAFGQKLYTVEQFGALCDGVTNDTNAFQQGLNYISANATIAPVSSLAPTTIMLVSPGKSCVVGDVTVPSFTGLGSIASSPFLAAPKLIQLAGSTYILKNTSAVTGVSVSGLALQGTGSATTSVGVYFPAVSRSSFSNNQFNNFGSSALQVATTSGAGNFIRNNLAQNAVLNHAALVAKTGVLTIGGTDNFVDSNEATCSLSALTSTNLYCIAIYFPSGSGAFGNHFITNNVGEISDIGIEDDASTDRLSGNRGDLNFGPGFMITGSEQVVNNLALNDSQSANGAYSAFVITGNTGLYDNNLAYTQVANAHKYGFEDSITSDSVKNFYGPTNRSFGQTLSTYKLAAFAGSAVTTPGGQAKTLADSSATPSVDNYGYWRANNTVSVTYTNFTNGFPGQIITVIFINNGDHIANGGGINTPGGATIAYNAGQVQSLINDNGTWKFLSNNP